MNFKIILFFFLTFCTFYCGISQRYFEVVKWEAGAKNGGKFFGITETKDEAQKIINDIIVRNEKFSYAIISKRIQHASVKMLHKNENPLKSFKKFLRKKKYIVLKPNENKALEIVTKDSLNDAVVFYMKSENISNEDVAFSHVSEIHKLYSRFMFSRGRFQLATNTE